MILIIGHLQYLGFPGGAVIKNPPAKAGDARNAGSVSELERSAE